MKTATMVLSFSVGIVTAEALWAWWHREPMAWQEVRAAVYGFVAALVWIYLTIEPCSIRREAGFQLPAVCPWTEPVSVAAALPCGADQVIGNVDVLCGQDR